LLFREWILIILGITLIAIAALNLVNFSALATEDLVDITPPVDQYGFVPIFVSKDESEQSIVVDQTDPPIYPERLLIEKIHLDAPVLLAQSINVTIEEENVIQYLIPEEFAVGWHLGSAPLGKPGNTVLSGHHNAFGKVFADLNKLEIGDKISLQSGEKQFEYVISERMIFPERGQPFETRLENSRWILPTDDERVTLVTCWLKNSNTHRLVLVAVPLKKLGEESLSVPVTGGSDFSNESNLIIEKQPDLAAPSSNWVSDKDEMEMVYIPAGEFLMGTEDKDAQRINDNGVASEMPAHRVYLDEYWIDQHEVTNGQYALCVSAGVCEQPNRNQWSPGYKYFQNSEYADYPVIYVNWNMARTFCEWTGQAGDCLPKRNGKRQPVASMDVNIPGEMRKSLESLPISAMSTALGNTPTPFMMTGMQIWRRWAASRLAPARMVFWIWLEMCGSGPAQW